MRISEILTDGSKWCQDAMARNAAGFPVKPKSSEAASWCLAGALSLSSDYNNDCIRLEYACQKLFGHSRFVFWQDRPNRTWKDVANFIKEAGV